MKKLERQVVKSALAYGAIRSNRSPNEMGGAVNAFRRFHVLPFLKVMQTGNFTPEERLDPETWKYKVDAIVSRWNKLLTAYPDLQKFGRSLRLFGLMNRTAAGRDFKGVVSWMAQIISGLETLEAYLKKAAGRQS